ncbi:cytochrome P450 monooxygenase 85 [Heterobasidion irregulare TC 32-1]|uniref:Cytochrome P450 monooxygenase 85 n=1 Tax=Heterobasidion irregulare (strain TC 32-1) TaxID=747525 RepID=W4JYT4_HETIT|nr:cytochrome P450 monooxygenase 85 [Heterobasidion irregulare TC 32-1]ETW78619.1 cytochrome P450 monooxygenase 85 [Heterobasidion irregulare TC 32-1]
MWIFLLDLVPVLLLCFSGILYARRKKATCPLSPGPKGLPIIGNVLDIPKNREWITYEKWGKEFGSDIIHVEAFGTHLIVLNSAKVAKELFERRSSLYSDRHTTLDSSQHSVCNAEPKTLTSFHVAGCHSLDIQYFSLHFDWTLAFLRYGPRWRNMRREFHRYFHLTAARQYHPIELDAAHGLLRRLMDTPTKFSSHIQQLTMVVLDVLLNFCWVLGFSRVVRTDRLPDFTDEAVLPYVTALMKKVLRWRPASLGCHGLAIPRRVVCDDVYDGYSIPKDYIVIGNTWAILHNETTYPEPDLFSPQRFLNAASTPSFPDAAFGFGRRIYPGRYIDTWHAMRYGSRLPLSLRHSRFVRRSTKRAMRLNRWMTVLLGSSRIVCDRLICDM